MTRTSLALLVLLSGPIPSRADDAKAGEVRLIDQPRADYRARRLDLMERIIKAESGRMRAGGPVVVLRGGGDRAGEDFEEGRFRQRNDFAYLTGVEVPGAWLILLPAEKRSTLYLPPNRGPSVMNGEDGHPAPGKDAADRYGFEAAEPTSRFLSDLFAAIADPIERDRGDSRAVYLLSPHPEPGDSRPDAKFARFLREGAPNATLRDLAPVVAEMRKVKTPAEIAILRKAVAITADANEAVIDAIRPGLYELQIEGRILAAFLNGGALRPGFKSIVGSGPNSTVPHYFLSGRRMADGELLVVDIGAEYRLYTADVTRTYPVNGTFTPRQREIYQIVLAAQAEAEAHMKPGVTRLADMTGFVRDYLRKSPLRARDSDGKEYTMDHFFIHGLSHYLGMDVHDVGDVSRPMRVGEVFTIEPGIYIKSENLGIRIEDDYLMTANGPEKLSKGITSDPDEIEKKIAGARDGTRKPD